MRAALRTLAAACLLLPLAACVAPPTRPVAPTPAAPEASPTPAARPPSIPEAPPATPAPAADASNAVEPVATVPPAPPPDSGAAVLDRLRDGFDVDACRVDRVIDRWIDEYRDHPTRLSDKLVPALPLLDHVSRRLQQEGLPLEFALLPLIESSYRIDVRRQNGPAGMWQFQPSTARAFGLVVTSSFDERLAPAGATEAAIRYLGALQAQFGNWRLAAMAFNAGDGRIRRALVKADGQRPVASATRHQPPGLAMSTYEYLAKLEALACILRERPDGIALPLATRFTPLQPARIPDGVDNLATLAVRLRSDAQTLRRWNPALPRGAFPPRMPRDLLLPHPASSAAPPTAATALAAATTTPPRTTPASQQPTARAASHGQAQHIVRRGDTLYGIARRYRVALADLMHWNGLRTGSILQPGQRLRLHP